jgi:hypothetical protein
MQDEMRVLWVFSRRLPKQQQAGHAQLRRKKFRLLCAEKRDNYTLPSSFNTCNPRPSKPLQQEQTFPHNVFPAKPIIIHQGSDNLFPQLAGSNFCFRQFRHGMVPGLGGEDTTGIRLRHGDERKCNCLGAAP